MSQEISPIHPQIPPPINSKQQDLPIELLNWQLFEELCLKMVEVKFKIEDCERYGKPGQNQQGIDIFARNNDDSYAFFQCKRYTDFKRSDLDKVIEKFRKGKFFNTSKEFYICTPCEMNDNKVQDAFEEYKTTFKKDHNIKLIKWDKIQLSRILKDHPRIVYDIWGPEYVKVFNGEEALNRIFDIPDSEIISNIRSDSGELTTLNNCLHNLPQSHIPRKETETIYEWICQELKEKDSNIAILSGNAGTGKTVILKDLIDKLNETGIPVLGLKADKRILNDQNPGKYIFNKNTDIQRAFQQLTLKYKTCVLIVDQIDALSQSLTSNREQINSYTSLISGLASIENVRIVISCRIFDLNHDVSLKQFISHKNVRVTPLSEEEVKAVLRQLTGGNLRYSKDLIILLKTPLHLDLFCRIYNESIVVNEIKNIQDLYRNLWNQKIRETQSNTGKHTGELENVLYQLAEKIYERQENLSVPDHLFDRYYESIQYLKSENLIVAHKSQLQFFHQTFYDYTYARFFVEKKGGEIFLFLLNLNHQGLFIRSITKQVITYLRDYDPTLYNDQVWKIIFSDEIRFHLKLLIIEYLAFVEAPSPKEFLLIAQVIQKNNSLKLAFFNSNPGSNWYKYFKRNKKIITEELNRADKNSQETISRFVVMIGGKNDFRSTVQFLKAIEDSDIKHNLIRWLLIRTDDFSDPLVIQCYHDFVGVPNINDKETLYIIRNAIKSKPDFAIEQANKIFDKILTDWKKKRNRELGADSKEREFIHFCEDLVVEHPILAYPFLKRIILALIEKTIIAYPAGYKSSQLKEDFSFQEYNPETYEHHKYLDWMVDSLCSNEDKNFVSLELDEYLSSKKITLMIIAFRALLYKPELFLEKIKSILLARDQIEDIFDDKDLKYYYRELLKESYLLFDEDTRSKINRFILSFYSKNDLTPNMSYYERRRESGTVKNKFYPLPFFGFNQWLLLSTIPEDVLKPQNELRLRFLMWERRFTGWDNQNKKPNHSVSLASFYGGLVSKERYGYFTDEQWLSSFIKYNGPEHDSHFSRHFSIEEHSKAFKEEVINNSMKHYPLVFRIIHQNEVHTIYQQRGLEGLMEAQYDVYVCWKLYALLMKRDLDESYLFSFLDSSKYFVNQSLVRDELIDFWKKYVTLPIASNENRYLHDSRDEDDRNDKLFSEGWRTINSYAIKRIVRLSVVKAYKEEVFKYLIEICDVLPIQLKLVTLQHLDDGSEFNSEQLLELFLRYTNDVSSEVYTVSKRLLSHLFYEHFDVTTPFLYKTMMMKEAAKPLGAHLLFGWFYGHEQSKELLFKLHEIHPNSIGETITYAMRYLKEYKYKKKCLFILNRYAKNQMWSFMDNYSTGFHELIPDDFLSLKHVIRQYFKHSNEESMYSLYAYLFKCSKDYPNECLEIMQEIDYQGKRTNPHDVEDPIKLIILCYNSLGNYETNTQNLEYAMDVFDKLLQQVNKNPEIDKILKDLDTPMLT